MNIRRLFDLFRGEQFPRASSGSSANAAKQRLQVILAYERPMTRGETPDFLPLMQREILDVIRKYVSIDERKLKIEVEREQNMSMLAVSVELPHTPADRPN